MNDEMDEFKAFPKIARLSREATISEKIDGTNAQVFIWDDNKWNDRPEGKEPPPRSDGIPWPNIPWIYSQDFVYFAVGSRNRWVTSDDDNYGFARWCLEHRDELVTLGHGRHFGEWWGSGIQRGYGLSKGDKRFSLFNTIRWCLHGSPPQLIPSGNPAAEPMFQEILPACVGLVPVLHRGIFSTREVDNALFTLFLHGSVAAPGYQKPEGVVVWHTAANIGFKKTFDRDDIAKGLQ